MGENVARYMLDVDNPKEWFGRIKKYPRDKSIKFMYTLGVTDFCPDIPEEKQRDEGKRMQLLASLAGFIVRHFEYAINTKNLFTLDKTDFEIVNVDTYKKFRKMMKVVRRAPIVGLDSETKNLSAVNNSLITLQIAVSDKRAYIIPFNHPQANWSPSEMRKIRSALRSYFECGPDDNMPLSELHKKEFGDLKFHIYQNGKFDLKVLKHELNLRHYGWEIYDVSAGEYALDENLKILGEKSIYINGIQNTAKEDRYKPYALDYICLRYGWNPYKDAGVDKNSRKGFAEMSLDKFERYAALDVIVLFRIMACQIARADHEGFERQKFLKGIVYVLGSMSLVFADMEYNGHEIDVEYLLSVLRPGGKFQNTISELNEKFRTSKAARRVNKKYLRGAGAPQQTLFGGKPWEFQIGKPDHQQRLFMEELGLEPLGFGKSGAAKIDKKFLEKYGKQFLDEDRTIPNPDFRKEAGWFAELKKSKTLRSNFLVPIWDRWIDEPDMKATRRLRAQYNYLYIITGRSGCFPAGTLVSVTDDRVRVPIENIKPGDKVWSTDAAGKIVEAEVSWQGITKHTEFLVHVGYMPPRGGPVEHVTCTPEHKFRLVDGSYKEARWLKRDDRIISQTTPTDKTPTERSVFAVMLAHPDQPRIPVYDITVPATSNFFVSYDAGVSTVNVHNSSDPNFQNIPSHGPLAKLVKRCFIASDGRIYLKVDYSAHEVRNWANVSGDEVMGGRFIEALKLKRRFLLTDRESEKFQNVVDMLKQRGDIHIQNVKFFFDKWVDKKHPLRQKIKVIIFGVIYGKGPFSLAIDLNSSKEEAEELIAKLFSTFRTGGDWLNRTMASGRQNFIIDTPFGLKRHLWGYFIPNKGIAGSMDRRGPNSLIQGPSSQQGYIGARQLQHLKWKYFYSKNLPLVLTQNNMVHDSNETESSIAQVPINLYLIEHALTTQVAKVCMEHFDWKFEVDLDCEFEIGGSLADMHGWSQRHDELPGVMDKAFKFMKDDMKRDVPKSELRKFEHNLDIMSKLRLSEVRKDMKADKYPSTRMNLDHELVKELKL